MEKHIIEDIEKALIFLEDRLLTATESYNFDIEKIDMRYRDILAYNPKSEIKNRLLGLLKSAESACEQIYAVHASYPELAGGISVKGNKREDVEIKIPDTGFSISGAVKHIKKIQEDLDSLTTRSLIEEKSRLTNILSAVEYLKKVIVDFDKLFEAETEYGAERVEIEKIYTAEKEQSKKEYEDAAEKISKNLSASAEALKNRLSAMEIEYAEEKFSVLKTDFHTFTEEIVLGRLLARIKDEYLREALELFSEMLYGDKNALKSGTCVAMPFKLRLSSCNPNCGDSNLYVEYDGDDCAGCEFLGYLLTKIFLSFPPKYASAYILSTAELDNALTKQIGGISGMFGRELLHGGIVSSRGFKSTFDDIKELLQNRRLSYSEKAATTGTAIDNITEYNSLAPDNKHTAVFLILHNYPENYSQEDCRNIEAIAKNGNDCGIFTYMFRNTSCTESAKYQCNAFDKSLKIQIADDKILCGNSEVILSLKDDKFDPKEISAAIKEGKKQTKPIILNGVWETAEKDKTDSSEVLRVPIGKSGNEIQYLELDSDGTTAHTLLAGFPGSGKSAFLHTLILSGAYKYSPEQLGFYLVDLKSNTEFEAYRTFLKLPHIKLISDSPEGEQDIAKTRDLLEGVVREMSIRNAQFKTINARGIVDYNKRVIAGDYDSAKLGVKKPFPRMLLIIDEYESITRLNNVEADMCIDLLLILAKKARSAGISLVLASQNIPVNSHFAKVVEQIRNKIVFSSSENTLAAALPRGYNRYELEREKGNAYISTKGLEQPVLFRSAYSGDPKMMAEYGFEVMAKYPWAKSNLIISGDYSTLPVSVSGLSFAMNYSGFIDETPDTVEVSIGVSGQTGMEIETVFSKDSTTMFIIGDRERAKNQEATMLSSILVRQKYTMPKGNYVYYIDFKGRVGKEPGVKDLTDKLPEYITYAQKEEARSVLSELISLAKKRAANPPSEPIYVFINSCERIDEAASYQAAAVSPMERLLLNNSGSKNENPAPLSALMELAKDALIYLVFHFEKPAALANKEIINDRDFVLKNVVFTNGQELLKTADIRSINSFVSAEQLKIIHPDDQASLFLNKNTLKRFRPVIFDESSRDWLTDFITLIQGTKQ